MQLSHVCDARREACATGKHVPMTERPESEAYRKLKLIAEDIDSLEGLPVTYNLAIRLAAIARDIKLELHCIEAEEIGREP